jgi:branched-subunit amino acid transport protein
VATTLAAWRTRNLGLSIAAGMLAFWLLRIPF